MRKYQISYKNPAHSSLNLSTQFLSSVHWFSPTWMSQRLCASGLYERLTEAPHWKTCLFTFTSAVRWNRKQKRRTQTNMEHHCITQVKVSKGHHTSAAHKTISGPVRICVATNERMLVALSDNQKSKIFWEQKKYSLWPLCGPLVGTHCHLLVRRQLCSSWISNTF